MQWQWPMLVTHADGRQEYGLISYDWNASETAFNKHLDEHGCGTPGRPNFTLGFAYCDEAVRLFSRLPPSKQIILAGRPS